MNVIQSPPLVLLPDTQGFHFKPIADWNHRLKSGFDRLFFQVDQNINSAPMFYVDGRYRCQLSLATCLHYSQYRHALYTDNHGLGVTPSVIGCSAFAEPIRFVDR